MCGGRHHDAMRSTEMAAAQGVDVQRALASGRLSAEDWRGAVVACGSCGQQLSCHDWHEARFVGRRVSRPKFCANLSFFHDLR